MRLLLLTLIGTLLGGNVALAAKSLAQTKLEAESNAKQVVHTQLSRYCADSCELIRLDVQVREEVSEITELGFEAIAGDSAQPQYYVEKITAEVQVDQRITADNRERLRNVLQNHMRKVAPQAEVIWQPVALPKIGTSGGSIDNLIVQAENQLKQAVDKTIQRYCPDTCVRTFVSVRGDPVSLDEANALPRSQVVRDAAGQNIMRVNQAQVEVAVDDLVPEVRRTQILNILEAQTKFIAPLDLSMTVSQFPQTYADQLAQERGEDPYGLEKLRRMLILFRDLAGTKEIITNTTESSEESITKASELNQEKITNSSNNSSSSKTNNSSESEKMMKSAVDSTTAYEQNGMIDWAIYGGLALALILVIMLAIRFAGAKKDAASMIAGAPAGAGAGHGAGQAAGAPGMAGYGAGGPLMVAGSDGGKVAGADELAKRLKVESLKQDLTNEFMNNPKVAKETFSRMLKEEGVETTANYLKIFGYMIVVELINDPNLTRDLYALSEYFNKSNIQLEPEQEYDLLLQLKSRQTAAEIKVLSNRGSDKFDFLERLDPAQIYALISEEKAQVQSIVLTQLDKKRRMAVFDMYQGDTRIALMHELCRAEAVPKEYMTNIAKALYKKVDARPEFDTQNIRSSEIIIDLLERSEIFEQRQIMTNLRKTNPDAARAILMKLVTVEILPYLKDGHLIEIILGMEREDLLTFLVGTRDHIRDLLLGKAPYELSQSWMEDLQHMGSVDEKNYRLVELKVFNRLRNLANSGAISVLDINEMVFVDDSGATDQRSDQGGYLDPTAVAV